MLTCAKLHQECTRASDNEADFSALISILKAGAESIFAGPTGRRQQRAKPAFHRRVGAAPPVNVWCPTRIGFGPGCAADILTHLQTLGTRRVLLVTGKRWATASGLRAAIEKPLHTAEVEAHVFARVMPEPRSTVVDAAVSEIQASGCDAVLGVGGGSAMDVAKLAALIATNGGACLDYEFGHPVTRPGLPVIAIPTTAGSGSEVTPYSVIRNAETGRKFTVQHPFLFPYAAVVDPELTVALPASITRCTALDAWVHGLEGYLSRLANPLVDFWAWPAVGLVFRYLARAVQHPTDRAARTNLSQAALMAGWVIAHVRTGMIHTLSVALAPYVDLPHGWLNAIITPYVLRFNLDAYNGRLRALVGSATQTRLASDLEALHAIIEWLHQLGVPQGLSHHAARIPGVANIIHRVSQDRGLKTVNPRPFSKQDLCQLLDALLRN